jgi:hypothetical protein
MGRIATLIISSVFMLTAFAYTATDNTDPKSQKPVYERQHIEHGMSLHSESLQPVKEVDFQDVGVDALVIENQHEAEYMLGTFSIPNTQIRVHKIGNLQLTVSNYGVFGSQMENLIDPETGMPAPSCEFPAGSGNEYLYQGGLWIGAVVNEDTLVSVGLDGWQFVNELYPDSLPGGDIIMRSNLPGSPYYSPDAISEEDYIAVYYDTVTNPSYVITDPFDGRPHIPLGLKIRQESYAWSSAEYEDFIIFRYVISNIAQNQLNDIYIGLYYDADILNPEFNPDGYEDDVSGSVQFMDAFTGQEALIGWAADNDGDPSSGSWNYYSPRGVLGVSLLKFPNVSDVAFNWWISNGYDPANYDWGPMLEENYRDFGTGGIGTPAGDRNKYYVMSNGEHDFDQMLTGIDHTGEGWLPGPPSYYAENLANGYDTRFLFSFGGADLNPGDSIELAFVLTVGDGFHKNPDDFSNLFDADNPQLYYDSLDFSSLIDNVQTARQLYRSLFPEEYICGDATGDGIININDVVFTINYLFLSGPDPYPYESANVNCDNKVNLIDVVYLVNYIFRGGFEPGDPNGDGIPDC